MPAKTESEGASGKRAGVLEGMHTEFKEKKYEKFKFPKLTSSPLMDEYLAELIQNVMNATDYTDEMEIA